jgi:hypothetical protein
MASTWHVKQVSLTRLQQIANRTALCCFMLCDTLGQVTAMEPSSEAARGEPAMADTCELTGNFPFLRVSKRLWDSPMSNSTAAKVLTHDFHADALRAHRLLGVEGAAAIP